MVKCTDGSLGALSVHGTTDATDGMYWTANGLALVGNGNTQLSFFGSSTDCGRDIRVNGDDNYECGTSARRWKTVHTNLLNVAGSSVNASAIAEFTSTTKGVLLPRMTTAQRNAIGSPATGLLIWNTDTTQLEDYNGAAWAAV
jgi:hypothetical protein